jgi:flagellar motor switch protein FliN/FliY
MVEVPEEIKKELASMEQIAKEEITKSKEVLSAKEFILKPLLENQPQEVADNVKLLRDIELEVVVEVGNTKMTLGEIAKLTIGSVVQLNKLAGDTVDIYVNGKIIAKGEVVVLDDNFAVRITEFIKPEE